MERLQVFGLFGLFILSGAQNSTSPSYLISAPKVLRPGIPTTLSITILTDVAVTVSAEIVNVNDSVAANRTTIEGGSTGLLVLPPIPNSEQGYWNPYKLVVKGHVGKDLVFTNATFMQFNPKSLFTFIQTDKPNYKPGHVVKIRAVSVHPDGRPYESPLDITIKDPKQNMIRQWRHVDSVLGVASKEFQLSENPPLGSWSIVTKVNEIVSEKQFRVDHYVLPKFEVLIEAPTVVYRDDVLRGTVTAKYMFGRPVHGYMNITYVHGFHGIDVSFNEEYEIDGTIDFKFEFHDYWEMHKRSADYMYDEYEDMFESLTVMVRVTEYLTGLTYNSTWEMPVAKCKYNLAFSGYPKEIKPSLNFSAELKISMYNMQPLSPEDREGTVTLLLMQHRRSPWNWRWDDMILARRLLNGSDPHLVTPMPEIPEKKITLTVPADGIIPIHMQLSDEVATLTIDASFGDGHKILQLFRSYSSPSQSYLQIQRPLVSPKVGVPLQLQIQSNFPLREHHYMVMSRGQVVSAGRGDAASLTLTPEGSWAPKACVIVYCVKPDGEIVNDMLYVPVALVLKNKVSVSWSKDKAKPAEEVSLKVSVSEPGSLVGLLVVDKAARSPQSDNDITKKMVLKEMASLGMNKPLISDRMRMGDPYSIFEMCNLMVLTDAKLEKMKDDLEPELLLREGIFHDYGHMEEMGEFWDMGPEPRLRSNFPETWLWKDTNTGDSTTAELSLTVPDSITSWVATAFVMSKHLGLGIMETPVELTVFQDLFLSLNLPAYIIRGEQLVVEVVLFNNLQQDLEVMIIVAESDSFEFVFPDNEFLSMASARQVYVRSQDGTSVLFPIRPLVLGDIPISVKAISHVASDRILKTVLVKPEGREESFSKSLLLELTPGETSLSRDVTFTFPADVVRGSERAQVTVVGDIVGPSITGLESLIQMPYGCGEQNMIHFAPNIYIIRYLEAVGQADPGTLEKATSYMMKGYERELSYWRDDGSFSAFGDSDRSGSTWLSAFVLRCFLQAQTYIFIDTRVLSNTASWLGAQQVAGGSFREPGRVIHTELQGGLDGPVSLTAYVLMALLEDEDYKSMYARQLSRALEFLETSLSLGISSNYSLCLATYALALGDSDRANGALDKLLGRADMRDGVPFWGSSTGGLADSWQPRSADIEMVAYLMLSLRKLNRVGEGVAPMRWLSQQRNHLGGYASTQDTVIALQALSEYAAYSGAQSTDLSIRVATVNSATLANFIINPTNYLLYQSQEIETGKELRLRVSAKGQGFALFQMNVFYNLESHGWFRRRRDAMEDEAFFLDIELFEIDTNYVHLHICTSLMAGQGINQTGMAILDVGLLSGFGLAQDGVELTDLIRKVETPPGKVVLYLDSVSTEEICVDLTLAMEYKVAKVQDATVVIYDYYEPRRKTAGTYTSDWRYDMSSCAFCGDDCSLCGNDYYMSGSVSFSQHRHLVASLVCALVALLSCCS